MTQSARPRVVLGYAGTPSGASSLRQLVAEGHDVVTVTLDFGQTLAVDHVRHQALALGATRAHVFDVRDPFASDFVMPALRSGALDALIDAVRTAPLTERKLAETAAIERADRIDGVHAFDVPCEGARGHYRGRTLLERPVADPAQAPDVSANVELQIEGGVPVAINGVALGLAELFESLALIAGQHGIGRLPHLDAPAAPLVHSAYRALDGRDGIIRFQLRKGELAVVPAHEPSVLVNQA